MLPAANKSATISPDQQELTAQQQVERSDLSTRSLSGLTVSSQQDSSAAAQQERRKEAAAAALAAFLKAETEANNAQQQQQSGESDAVEQLKEEKGNNTAAAAQPDPPAAAKASSAGHVTAVIGRCSIWLLFCLLLAAMQLIRKQLRLVAAYTPLPPFPTLLLVTITLSEWPCLCELQASPQATTHSSTKQCHQQSK